MRPSSPRLLARFVPLFLGLAFATQPLAATDFASNLLCLSNNTVTVTQVQFWCERPAACTGGPCTALPNATWTPSGLSCQGVTGPDGQAGVKGVNTTCAAGCELAARITYNCNGGANQSACLKVPAPGSGQAASVQLTCSPGAELTIAEGSCVETDTTLCFFDGRFRIQVNWRTASDEGKGFVIPVTTSSGLVYFFGPENIEMLIKMVNACVAPFNHFWLFFAATTNQEFEVFVTDTSTGQLKTYFNPLNRPAPPIQDTSAFATCP